MIAFVTTCKGRVQHLAQTLPRNMADNPEAKFVVLGYNDGPELREYLLHDHSYHIEDGRLTVYEYREEVPFRMAHAKNMVHRCGILEGATVLVNLDADNYSGPGFDSFISDQFQSPGSGLSKHRDDLFLWSRMVKTGEGRLDRGISGRIAVTKTAFILVGGYDEWFHTHSRDDRDFHLRLSQLGLESREIEPRFLNAVRHNDRMRFKEYPEAKDRQGEDIDVQPETAVVNCGNVGCGTVWRNFSSDPIEIKPIPTRIFGIGLHKTATTSLHSAFEILGFKSWHWKNAHSAKAIWREMNQTGKSPTIERYYALCDLPIPMLYQQLDKAYPGSKFILTVRDEAAWLESVRKHFTHQHNRFRHQWDTDPFSHKVHQMLYGRKDFDSTVFLERYRRHIAEICDYFRGRHDLLVMAGSGGWPTLCNFLNVPIPSQPYPFVGACRT